MFVRFWTMSVDFGSHSCHGCCCQLLFVLKKWRHHVGRVLDVITLIDKLLNTEHMFLATIARDFRDWALRCSWTASVSASFVSAIRQRVIWCNYFLDWTRARCCDSDAEFSVSAANYSRLNGSFQLWNTTLFNFRIFLSNWYVWNDMLQIMCLSN